jgi:deoxyribonuclease-4
MSIAGGYYKAVEAAAAVGMDTVQLFTKNNNQWRAKPLGDKDVRLFREALDRTGLQLPTAHDSYLINLASPDPALWKKSLDAFVIELERAEALGLAGVVMHPGAYTVGTEEEGLARIVQALDGACRNTKGFRTEIWLEVTAGQGTCLGHRFEHLAYILAEAAHSERMGVCIDTCHIFAAGYPLGTDEEHAATFAELDRIVGLDRVRAFHLNDSKRELGSRVDRHAHIGEGYLGLEPFRRILHDRRFARLPMYLETKKEKRDGEEMDAVNLRRLRELAAPVPRKKPPRRRRVATSSRRER